MKIMKLIESILILIFAIMLFGLVAALPTFILWNWLMPSIFGVKSISMLQALGLNFLSGILFKSSSTVSKK